MFLGMIQKIRWKRDERMTFYLPNSKPEPIPSLELKINSWRVLEDEIYFSGAFAVSFRECHRRKCSDLRDSDPTGNIQGGPLPFVTGVIFLAIYRGHKWFHLYPDCIRGPLPIDFGLSQWRSFFNWKKGNWIKRDHVEKGSGFNWKWIRLGKSWAGVGNSSKWKESLQIKPLI